MAHATFWYAEQLAVESDEDAIARWTRATTVHG
jgi:hypothetical protein